MIDALREDFRQQQTNEAGKSDLDASLAQMHLSSIQTLDQIQKLVLDRCREAVQLLATRVSDAESGYYRRGVVWMCWQVARSAREEGGLFGINSVQVTENEQQVIRKIGFALGISAQETQPDSPASIYLPDVPARRVPHALADRFTREEWEVLRQAPVWVGVAVSAAAPSGALGTVQELNALMNATQETVMRFGSNRLIADLMDDMSLLTSQAQPAVETPTKLTALSAGKRAVELCRQAAGIVDQKASLQEASEYKQMLALIARRVAHGAQEGGVLGIGAHKVSQAEQSLLDEISHTLGIPL